jgi:hypothetical protein
MRSASLPVRDFNLRVIKNLDWFRSFDLYRLVSKAAGAVVEGNPRYTLAHDKIICLVSPRVRIYGWTQ